MGNMKLDTLTLRNFKGTSFFTLNAGCVDTSVWGDNATGKTTLADAASWLLTDKDSLGQSQFEIFPIGKVGTEHKPLESEVEGVFVNGEPVKLKKVYRQVFTKKRGQPKKEMTGNTTDYFIDDVPCTKTEYQSKVAAITAGSNHFQLLTNPHHFASLPWQDKRNIIVNMVGDITDEEVILSNPDLAELPGILDKKSCEDYKKICAGKRKAINETLSEIPGRIDEQDRSKPVLEKTNGMHFVDVLTKLRKKLTEKQTEISGIANGGGLVDLKLKLAAINEDMVKIVNDHNSKANVAIQAQKDELSKLKDDSAELKRQLRELVTKKGHLDTDLDNLKEVNKALMVKWNAKHAETFTAENCVTCGKPMTEQEADAARLLFNQAKATIIEKIENNGNENKVKAAAMKVSIEALDKSIPEHGDKITDTEMKISGLEKEIELMKAGGSAFYEEPEYIKAQEVKDKLLKEIEEYQAGNAQLTEKAQAEAEAIQEEINKAERSLSLIEQVQKADNRIAELMAEEKKLAAEFEVLERHLFLIETFTRAKVSMLDDKINEKFELVKFRMFKDQVNGGLQEVCDITVNDVPYNSLNTGARIQAGMDIIKTLSSHFEFKPVIFVDGCESVTSLPEMDTQLIRLIVSADDKELRVVQ